MSIDPPPTPSLPGRGPWDSFEQHADGQHAADAPGGQRPAGGQEEKPVAGAGRVPERMAVGAHSGCVQNNRWPRHDRDGTAQWHEAVVRTERLPATIPWAGVTE